MPNRDEITEIAKRLQAEIVGDAPKIAAKLFPATPPGLEKLGRDEYMAHVRSKWPDPQFRQDLLTRVGSRNFIDTAREMFGLTKAMAKDMADSASVAGDVWQPDSP